MSQLEIFQVTVICTIVVFGNCLIIDCVLNLDFAYGIYYKNIWDKLIISTPLSWIWKN